MTRLNVNPTRMELRRLKARLKTAVRGHKLLKDKSDEMIRQFMVYARKNKQLRMETEAALSDALKGFMLARAVSDDQVIEEAVAMPASFVEAEVSTTSAMGGEVPSREIKERKAQDMFPYSFSSVTAELDDSIVTLNGVVAKMVELAEVEKTCNMLADEIEKNRRRVNALEYVMIPELEETIKYISMKLEEQERSNVVRLMKVKDMIQNRD